MASECINPTIALFELQENQIYPEYKTLTNDDKKKVENFILVREKADNFALKMIRLESSVQVGIVNRVLKFCLKLTESDSKLEVN